MAPKNLGLLALELFTDEEVDEMVEYLKERGVYSPCLCTSRLIWFRYGCMAQGVRRTASDSDSTASLGPGGFIGGCFPADLDWHLTHWTQPRVTQQEPEDDLVLLPILKVTLTRMCVTLLPAGIQKPLTARCISLRRRAKLPQYNTVDDVIQLLKKCKRIVVLTGAGISVSCGIRKSSGAFVPDALD